MKIYLSASSKSRGDLCRDLGFGLIYSPAHQLKFRSDLSHIIDNGAWSAYVKNTEWSEIEFYKYLSSAVSPDFVIIPDIVAGGKESLLRSSNHINRIRFKKYLAVQDGITNGDIMRFLSQIDGIFVGGTMRWKLMTGNYWVNFAHANDKPCHIGRVGTYNTYSWAYSIGADSVDGSTPVRHNKIHLIPGWIREIQNTVRLTT